MPFINLYTNYFTPFIMFSKMSNRHAIIIQLNKPKSYFGVRKQLSS